MNAAPARPPTAGQPQDWRVPAALALLACLLQWALYASPWGPGLGNLSDPDGYMRLVRAGQLVQGTPWQDHRIPRSDPPEGETLHWSRPLDVLLLAGAAPLAPWLGWQNALLAWGAAISPVLMAAAGLLLCLRLAAKTDHRLLAAVLFFSQAAVIQQCAAGRPDHHALLLLLAVWALTETRAMLRVRGGSALPEALRAGVACGLGCWTSLEFLPAAALVAAALAAACLGPRARAQRAFRTQAAFAVTFALVGLGAAWSEGRQASAAPDCWTPAHAAAVVLYAGGAAAAALAPSKGLLHRAPLLLLAVAFAPAVVGAGLLFHLLLPDPYGPVPPLLREVWLDHIAEIHPVQDQTHPRFWGWLIWFFSPLAASLFLVFRAWKAQRLRRLLPSSPPGWLALGALATWAALASTDYRWTLHAAIPGTWSLLHATLWLRRGIVRLPGPGPLPRLLRAGLVLVLAAGYLPFTPLAVQSPFQLSGGPGSGAASVPLPAVPLSQAADALNRLNPENGALVLAPVDDGPELLYRTRAAVLATPYHRNLSGMGASRAWMSDVPAGQALEDLRRRGVRYVLWRGDAGGRIFWGTRAAPGSLFALLESGHTPDGLVPRAREGGRAFIWELQPGPPPKPASNP